ncbi:MAG: adaptor protein MecA [Lachnospiraceae bacterium]|nr:adaptor protein MecA [Lachnospiraceae bacterium]
MKFTKIDENTVRCIVSQEEMEAYDVELEDFVKKSKKVKDFVELLIDKAEDEVGYEHAHGMMQIQLQPLPKRGLAITFSSREVTPEELSSEIAARMGDEMADAFLDSMDGLSEEERQEKIADAIESMEEYNKEPKDTLEEIKKVTSAIEQVKNALQEANGSKNGKLGKSKKESTVKGKNEAAMGSVPDLYICKFRSMTDIGRFCMQVPMRYFVDSSIYKDTKQGIYYVIIQKGRCKKVKYLFTCRLALEFGVLDSCSETRLAYITEQCQCLVAENAIKVFRKIYGA